MTTAFLAMDLQRGILEANTNDPGYLPRVGRAIDAARAAHLPIIYVVVRFRDGHPEISPRNKTFSAVAQAGLFSETDPAAEIHPSVAPQPGDVVVAKRRVGAFAGSDLDVVLRARGVDTLVLTGVSTSGVVLSTVRLAADLDFQLTVLSDGCFDPDPEVHRVLTEKVFPRQAQVTTIDAWLDARNALAD